MALLEEAWHDFMVVDEMEAKRPPNGYQSPQQGRNSGMEQFTVGPQPTPLSSPMQPYDTSSPNSPSAASYPNVAATQQSWQVLARQEEAQQEQRQHLSAMHAPAQMLVQQMGPREQMLVEQTSNNGAVAGITGASLAEEVGLLRERVRLLERTIAARNNDVVLYIAAGGFLILILNAFLRKA
jgi:hypothetical protein